MTRDAYRAAIDDTWNKAYRAKHPEEPINDRRTAGADSAVADLIDWLASNRGAIELVQAIGNSLSKRVLPELESTANPSELPNRKSMANHFWCDLLAGMACAYEGMKRGLHGEVERTVKIALQSRRENERPVFARAAVKIAAQITWTSVTELSHSVGIEDGVRAVRILAILTCPEPENHMSVARCCMAPLTGGLISEETRTRLSEVFSTEWLSEIQDHLTDDWQPLRLRSGRVVW
jgi:hypothetical protein